MPGTTTTDGVRERWGAPSRETKQKVEGYDTTRCIYEGDRAPSGLKRMTVDFGLLAPDGYRPNIARLLTLEPKPGIFGHNTVLDGWGDPDGFTGKQGENLSLYFRDGLLVFFDKDDFAVQMVFSAPQPAAQGQGERARRRPPRVPPASRRPRCPPCQRCPPRPRRHRPRALLLRR